MPGVLACDHVADTAYGGRPPARDRQGTDVRYATARDTGARGVADPGPAAWAAARGRGATVVVGAGSAGLRPALDARPRRRSTRASLARCRSPSGRSRLG